MGKAASRPARRAPSKRSRAPPKARAQATVKAPPAPPPASESILARVRAISLPALGAIAFTLLFIGVTVWWLTQDLRMPHFDPGRHTVNSLHYYQALNSGDVGTLFTLKTWPYPPLVHWVGMVGMLLGGTNIWQPVLFSNLVFVSLLALACYQIGKLVFGVASAGLFAVVFALGTPMIVGQSHLFMLDVPQASMVAVSVWLLLASRSFERPWIAGLAGAAVGAGLLTKVSFVVFVAGVVIVMLARGGWRNRKGLIAFVAGALLVAGWWYVVHLSDIRGLYRVGGLQTPEGVLPGINPPRFSLSNVAWYFWSGINFQYLAPLLILAIVGVVVTIVRLRAKPSSTPLAWELLAGAGVGWLGVTWQLPHDARYSLPLLVYVAVLGTGWIALLSIRWRMVAGTLLVVVASVNLIGASTGAGGETDVAAPFAPALFDLADAPDGSMVRAWRATLYTDTAYAEGQPRRGGDLLGAMRQLHDRGLRTVYWEDNGVDSEFNNEGLGTYAELAGLTPKLQGLRRPDDLYLSLKSHGFGPPCLRLYNGRGVWVLQGSPDAGNLEDVCPR